MTAVLSGTFTEPQSADIQSVCVSKCTVGELLMSLLQVLQRCTPCKLVSYLSLSLASTEYVQHVAW